MPLADPTSLIDEAFARGFRPPERLTVDQWADRFRTVFKPSPREGPWDTDFVPFLREPMRRFTDIVTITIVLMFGPQSSKTELLLNVLGWIVDCQPDDTMYILPTAEMVQEFVKTRVHPMLRENPRLTRHLSLNRHDTKLQAVHLPEMNLFGVGSNSAGKLSNKPIRWLLCDEVDKYPQELGGKGGTEAAALDLAKQRTDAFGWMAKIVEASTPSDEGVGISREYASSDQAEYWVPCPLCGVYQTLRFAYAPGQGGVRWEGGTGREMNDRELAAHADKVRASAWYECAACEGRIESATKSVMLLAGVWCRSALGQRIVQDNPAGFAKWLRDTGGSGLRGFGDSGLIEGLERAGAAARGVVGSGQSAVGRKQKTTAKAPLPTAPWSVRLEPREIERSVRGFRMGQLYSPFKTFGDAAVEFVLLRGEPNRKFVNGVLGEPWKQSGQRTEEHELAAVIEAGRGGVEGAGRWRYSVGQLPGAEGDDPGPLVVMVSIDVQAESVWYVVRAFGERERSWLVEWGELPCPSDKTLARGVAGGSGGGNKQTVREYIDEATGEVLMLGPDDPRALELEADRWAAVMRLLKRKYARLDGGVPGVVPGEVPVRLSAIDSGDRTMEVYRFVLRARAEGITVVAVKGSGGGGSGGTARHEPHRWVRIGNDPKHPITRYGDIELLHVNTLTWSDYVAGHRLRGEPQHGAWMWPLGVDEVYLRQTTAEHRVLPKGRSPTPKWELRPGRKDNHLGDCERNLCAVADVFGMPGWTAAKAGGFYAGAAKAGPGKGNGQSAVGSRGSDGGGGPGGGGARVGGARIRT
jgi:phage terminase large subunit GpA-like protein